MLERLAPLSAPDLMVRDERPLWGTEVELAIADSAAALPGGRGEAVPEDEVPTQPKGAGGFDALDALRGALDAK